MYESFDLFLGPNFHLPGLKKLGESGHRDHLRIVCVNSGAVGEDTCGSDCVEYLLLGVDDGPLELGSTVPRQQTELLHFFRFDFCFDTVYFC